MAEDAVLRISAEIDEYKRVLAKIPGITQKQAKLASAKLAKELSKGQVAASNSATKAAKKSAKSWTDSTGDTKAGFESMKQAAEAFGGQVGAAAGIAEKLGRSFMEAGKFAGPVGVAFGGVALAVAGVGLAAAAGAKALFAIMDAADQAIDRLKEIEGTKPIPRNTIVQLDAWRQAALGAEAAGERLKVILAGELAGAFLGTAQFLTVIANGAATTAEAVGNLADRFGGVSQALRTAVALFSGGGSEILRWAVGFDAIAEASSHAADGLVDAAKAAEENTEAMLASVAANTEWVALQKSAILAMTGATDAQIKNFAALERVDAAAQARIETLDAETLSGQKAIRTTQNHAEKMKGLIQAEFEATEATKRRTAAMRAASEAAREQAKLDAEAAENAKKLDQFLQGVRKGREAGAKMEAAHAKEMIQLEIEAAAARAAATASDLADAAVVAAKQKAADDEATKKRRQIQDLAVEGASVAIDAIGAVLDAQIQASRAAVDAALNNIDELREVRKDAAQEQKDLNDRLLTDEQRAAQEKAALLAQEMADRSGASQAAIDATRAEAKADIKAEKRKLKSARRQAKKLAKGQKALGLLDVGVNTAAAIMKAFALFGPPPSPPGVAAAGIAAAAGLTQAGIVASQKPPQFHQGNVPAFPSFTGGPDEFLALQRAGESTLNQRATEEIGRGNVEKLNQTGALPSAGATFVNVLDGRTISRAMQRDAARRGTAGALGMRGGPIGVQDVFGAG